MLSIPESWRGFAALPLRLALGGALAVAGFAKLVPIGGLGFVNIVHELSQLGVPQPEVLAWLVGIAELVCGLGLLLGAFTTTTSIVMLINLGGLVVLSLIRGIEFPETLALKGLGFPYRFPSLEASALFIAGLSTMLIGGPGRWSVDRWLTSRNESNQRTGSRHAKSGLG